MDDEPIDFKTEGKILGLAINSKGYNVNVKERKTKALAALRKLYRFRAI